MGEMAHARPLIKNGDACMHCGQCRENCSFLGKYGLDMGDMKQLKELAYHCFLCGTCSSVCPAGIDGRGMMLEMRRAKVEKNQGKCLEKGCAMVLAEKQNYLFRNKRYMTGETVLFPGCSFPSYYPDTTRKLIQALKEVTHIGVLFDCCGKPVAELGLKSQEERIVSRLNQNLREAGAKEVVMLCPNCYDFLKDKLEIRVTSIYEKLSQCGIGGRVKGRGALFLPCPDRGNRQWAAFISPFFENQPPVVRGVQCCGLGGCAGAREPELAKRMGQCIAGQGHERVYTYCASCTGNLTRMGCPGVVHVLPEILGSAERPDTGKPAMNRMMTKFWKDSTHGAGLGEGKR